MTAVTTFRDWLIWGGLAAFGVMMVGIYCSLETSLYVLNRIRLELKSQTGNRRAKYLRAMYRKPNQLLTVLLIGTNVFSYLATFAVSILVLHVGIPDDRAEFYTIAIAAPLLFAFSDAVPKNVSRIIAERIAYGLCWVLRISDAVFTFTGVRPLLQVLSGMWVRLLGRKSGQTDMGLAAVISEAHASGVITSS
ncbi:MAG TPA: DUF21 domain-containing protein, partial [Phycisphaerae bacterium]|nr:DUF21 domain-containing protein [Phycisphaerae bacterium]